MSDGSVSPMTGSGPPSHRGDRRSDSSGAPNSDGRPIPPPPDRAKLDADQPGVDRPDNPQAEPDGFQAVVAQPEDRSETRIERVEADPPKPGSKRHKAKGSRPRRRRRKVNVESVEFGNITVATTDKLRDRLAEAAVAFEAERFTEADRLLVSIERLAPDVAEVHELMGLTRYRLGQWRRAIVALERFEDLTGSLEQHPVIADCHRAMKNWRRTEELWLELGQASPSPELIEEGRIVQAGTMADRGRLADAIRFMEKAPKVKGKPGTHHLRRWYATADLYERAGDNSRARRLFADIANANPDFGDAAERAAGL